MKHFKHLGNREHALVINRFCNLKSIYFYSMYIRLLVIEENYLIA